MSVLSVNGNRILTNNGKTLLFQKAPRAFAIYSSDDESLTFYATYDAEDIPSEGNTYNGKIVTEIYTGFEDEIYIYGGDRPWNMVRSSIERVSFDPSFAEIRPISVSMWFFGFENCTEIDLKYLNTSKAVSMERLFSGCENIDSLDMSEFNTSKVENMSYMFRYCSSLTSLDVSSFNTSNVTDTQGMFYTCNLLTNLNVDNFDTSNVLDMSYMFGGCENLKTLDVSGFNTAKVKNMDVMFWNSSSLETIYSNDNNFVITGLDANRGQLMFRNCSSLIGGNGTLYNEENDGAEMAHVDTASNPGYFTAK